MLGACNDILICSPNNMKPHTVSSDEHPFYLNPLNSTVILHSACNVTNLSNTQHIATDSVLPVSFLPHVLEISTFCDISGQTMPYHGEPSTPILSEVSNATIVNTHMDNFMTPTASDLSDLPNVNNFPEEPINGNPPTPNLSD